MAEEQTREVNGQISEEGFVSATSASAAIEAAANDTLKQEQGSGDKRLHPMFRRRSGSTSTTVTLDEEKPRKRRKTNGKVKEEPIELVDSDDDLDRVVDTKPARVGKKEESPESLDGQAAPEAGGRAERYVESNNPCALADQQSQPAELFPANVDVVDRHRVQGK